jgi:hypothetical protein
MSQKEIKKRGFSNQVNQLFGKHFPIRLNMYTKNGVLRKDMAEVAKKIRCDNLYSRRDKGRCFRRN